MSNSISQRFPTSLSGGQGFPPEGSRALLVLCFNNEGLEEQRIHRTKLSANSWSGFAGYRFNSSVIAFMVFLLVTGCSSAPKQSDVKAPVPQPETPSPAHPLAPEKRDLIKEAATKPPAPFEGEGWH